MKKILTTVLLGIFLISSAYSVNIRDAKATENLVKKAPKFEYIDGNAITVPSKNDQTQGAVWTKISDVGAPTFFVNGNYTNPIAYEPYSKTTVILEAKYGQASASDASYTGYLGYRSTTDYKTFSKYNSIYQSMGGLPTLPSFAVYNPTKSTSTDAVKIYAFSTFWSYSAGNYSMDFSRHWFYDKGNGTNYQDIREPDQNPDSDYWWDASASVYTDGTDEFGYISSRLTRSSRNPSCNFGFGVADIKAVSEYNSIPSYWSNSNFRADVSSTYNGNIYTDLDQDGVIYSATASMFITDDQVRTLGVSKSSTGGESFSNWDQLPKTVYTEFCNTVGTTDASKCFIFSYQSDAFKVTGTDSYSYLCWAYLYQGETQNPRLYVAEIQKQNGTWKMYVVSETTPQYIMMIKDNAPTGVTTLLDSLDRHSKDHEMQLSQTSDGQYLVAKWIDYSKAVVFSQETTLNGGEILGDTLAVTDVFMSYKKIGDNQWSEAVNVTNDDLYNKFTYIPSTIESINKIPLLSFQTRHISSTTPSPYEKYPEWIFQRIVDYPQSIYYTLVDIQNVSEVKEVNNFNLTLNGITPNPANEASEISFTVNNPSNVTLEVYNNLGQLVKVLINGKVNVGFQAINAKFEDLSSGTYFLKLSDGVNSVTKNLVIVK